MFSSKRDRTGAPERTGTKYLPIIVVVSVSELQRFFFERSAVYEGEDLAWHPAVLRRALPGEDGRLCGAGYSQRCGRLCAIPWRLSDHPAVSGAAGQLGGHPVLVRRVSGGLRHQGGGLRLVHHAGPCIRLHHSGGLAPPGGGPAYGGAPGRGGLPAYRRHEEHHRGPDRGHRAAPGPHDPGAELQHPAAPGGGYRHVCHRLADGAGPAGDHPRGTDSHGIWAADL